ncbi:DNA cytosine methyltransferase [Xanthomonas cucurbitae]|uniref:Cytosine-specific methyltransferase n=1 Tax=Xanthomonas cucurbitae TaxID=56453 RepID=A0ABY7YD31_9XANT|nr:DNA cytosine methyltransferase [Xanthomonas cucurbitae]WDM67916.1 DNA cytosine methyltransferase [Xanthomonas cucurbitae]WDM71790.1 DNA cytosine methyltransferase [Xanthomonas cucurbitae]
MKKKKTTTVPTALSLFSGCGGFCEGMKTAGFDIRAAVEMDRFACETYRHNFPSTPLIEGDVHDFLKPRSSDAKKYRLDDLDVVFGGPPCQGYSQIGTRRLDDERNELYLQYARIVEKQRPRVFLMENVPNMVLLNKGHFRKLILEKFASIGYSNAVVLRLTAADFGVPQLRQRVIFVGTRDEDDFAFDMESFCEAVLDSLKVRKHVTVREAIDDLPDGVVHSGEVMEYPEAGSLSKFQKMMRLDYGVGHYTKAVKRQRGLGEDGVVLHNHHTKEIQARRANLISMLEPGKKADSLPKEIWDGKRPEKWRRLHPDEPSYTILAHMHRDLSEWVHPYLDRWITVREAARLQSFHDGFVFQGSEWQQLKQIGNAVPPLMGHALGVMAQEILKALDEGEDYDGLAAEMIQLVAA